MATPSPTKADHVGNTYMHTWVLTTADHTGVAIELPGAADRTVQFTGTWGSATGGLEGSNDGSTFAPLTNPSTGSAIAPTTDATGISAVMENPRYIRPRLTAVGSGATVTVRLFSRRT